MEYNDFGKFAALNTAAVESAKELETINGKVVEKLAQKNMDFFSSAMELNNKFVSLFGDVKSVQDLMTQQLQLASEYNGKVVATMKEAAEIVMESKDDYQAWFEAGVTTATDAPKKTTKKAA